MGASISSRNNRIKLCRTGSTASMLFVNRHSIPPEETNAGKSEISGWIGIKRQLLFVLARRMFIAASVTSRNLIHRHCILIRQLHARRVTVNLPASDAVQEVD